MARISLFPTFFLLMLSNISENGFSFLPAGTNALTRVGSDIACESQVSPLQSRTWLQLDLIYLRLGQEQKGITVATMAFLHSYITSIPSFMAFLDTKHNWTCSGPKELGSHLY